MKFAIHDGERKEAEANLKGAICPVCKADVIAKCGNININHWAHKIKKKCDPWWENETKWHREWKNNFPPKWQEIIHTSKTGEKHVADVKTPNGLVVEFQHSPIKAEEILARNTFYENIIWVVDGKRRKTDEKKFKEVLNRKSWAYNFWDNSRLLRDWSNIKKPVFFDFGKPKLHCIFEGIIFEFDKTDLIEGIKMGGRTLTLLLTKQIENIKEIEKLKKSLSQRNENRAWFGINNQVTKRYRRRGMRRRRF